MDRAISRRGQSPYQLPKQGCASVSPVDLRVNRLWAQQAEIARLEAEVPRDLEAQQPAIDRLEGRRRRRRKQMLPKPGF